MENKDLAFIQEQIGYAFRNPDLLQQAFVRRSYSQENGGEDNENLEFIGDAVLSFIVVKLMIKRFGSFIGERESANMEEEFDEFYCRYNEAALTEFRKRMVQKKTLADRIDVLDFAKYLIMGKGDVQNHIQEAASVKEDLFEAIIGAVTLDSDWDMAEMQSIVEIMLDPDGFFEEDAPENTVERIRKWVMKKYGTVPLFHFEAASQAVWYSPFEGISSAYNGSAALKYACLLKLGEMPTIFRSFGATKSEARKAVCELAYRELEKRRLLSSMKDEIKNPSRDHAVGQLEILARRGYFSIPTYQFEKRYDASGNPIWRCACRIKEKNKVFRFCASSKKEAKKTAAMKMLRYVLQH